MNVQECIKRIYNTNGLRGFYKGITASYFGISETVVHFVIYEALKKKLVSLLSLSFLQFLIYSLFHSWSCVRSDRKKVKLLEILLNSCLLELHRKPSRAASLTRMRLHERDCARREINIIASGKRCSWCGRKRERRDFIVGSRLNSFDKFLTQRS